jgi:hypothetical protein
MAKSKAVVKQNEENPIEVSVLADAIVAMDIAVRKAFSSGLNEKAIVCLIYDMLPQSMRGGKIANKAAIRAVIESLKDLRAEYCTR